MHQSAQEAQYISVTLPPVWLSTFDKMAEMEFISPVTLADDGLVWMFSK